MDNKEKIKNIIKKHRHLHILQTRNLVHRATQVVQVTHKNELLNDVNRKVMDLPETCMIIIFILVMVIQGFML